jgi:hypothetical protein
MRQDYTIAVARFDCALSRLVHASAGLGRPLAARACAILTNGRCAAVAVKKLGTWMEKADVSDR